jgi:putative RecB family exonuclease
VSLTDQPQQLTLGSMPQRLFTCTPSRLATFDCPRRYRMNYLDRPTPPRGAPWAHNTIGAVVHLALHRWWSLRPEHRTPDNGSRLVERHWQTDGFRDAEQSGVWRVRAGQWVRDYLEDHLGAGNDRGAAGVAAQEPGGRADPGLAADNDPVGVERTVSMRTDRLAVSGRVDRIDDRDGELVIVDYKTGRSVPGVDDARGSQALALYALAARRTLRRACRRVELHHLPSGTVAAFEHTDESFARHIARAEASADDIVAATDTLASGAAADDVFPPAPGPSCSWCDFRRNCPEGLAVSAQRESWAGLAEPLGS